MSIVFFLIGLIFLIWGGDWLVNGAVGIAQRFHLSKMLIGATVVSVGTTIPELLVSVSAAVSGHGQIAYGNAVGSVICNAALLAALVALIRPPKTDRRTLLLPTVFFFAAALLFIICAWVFGVFYRSVGICLLILFVLYLLSSLLWVRRTRTSELKDPDAAASVKPFWQLPGQFIVGVAAVAIGANLMVNSGTLLAQKIGVPESVIALTAVALGTSLPELITVITALIKRESALSLGNLIGANVMNLVLVCGASAAISPFPVPKNTLLFGINSSLIVDLPVMLIVMLILCLVPLAKGRLTRTQGAVLLAIYAVFCLFQFTAV